MKNGMKFFLIILAFVLLAAAGILFAQKETNKDDQSNNQNTASEENGSVAGTQNTTKSIVQPTPDQINNASYLFFYGATCSHCKKVEDWLEQNDPENNLNIARLEIYNNPENQKLLYEKFDQCKGLDPNDKGGVPFLFSTDKCVIGDTPVIDFLKEKL